MSDEWIKQQILPMIEEQADETLLLDLKPLWLNDEELRQVVTEYLIQLNSTNGTTQTYLAEYWQSEGDIKKEWDAWIAVLRDFIFGKHLGHTIAVRGLRKLSESGHGQQDWTLREQFLSFGGIELSPNPGEEILFNTTLDEQSFVFFWLEGDTDGEALVYTVPSYEEFEFSQVQMLHGGIGSSRSDHTVTYPWIQMGQDEWTYTEYGLKRKYTITMRKENETELHMTVKWEPSQF